MQALCRPGTVWEDQHPGNYSISGAWLIVKQLRSNCGIPGMCRSLHLSSGRHP